ncbi:glycosyltransferase family 4 protein [Paracoccus ravus]|uniref:glycosyltransferase family 4 protein n=1 Tax=Paracoccus ravus TaxID=2447760 RepID=UPI00106DE7D4|nr:glycosyltransferase family 4 protein [Paracoccus ravus]
MRIAFYAPLKPPDHPVPSGDRQMARSLMAALRRGGHRVELASELRAYLPDARDEARFLALQTAAQAERARLAALWRENGVPDVWFCYHPYCKSPDMIGPELAREFALPWVSAEASLSARRDHGIWRRSQALVADALAQAAVNFTLTRRDAEGLRGMLPDLRLAALPAFLDLDDLPPPAPSPNGQLVTVAMMRSGDKMESYRALSAALRLLPAGTGWQLDVAGDGPMRAEVRALFPAGKVRWHGQLSAQEVRALFAKASIYVWPGQGEAYGLAYLEAQAAGLPVVAWATAGVPEVVSDGETGLLAPEGDLAGLAAGIARLLSDRGLRRRMGEAARMRVMDRHGIAAAALILNSELQRIAR